MFWKPSSSNERRPMTTFDCWPRRASSSSGISVRSGSSSAGAMQPALSPSARSANAAPKGLTIARSLAPGFASSIGCTRAAFVATRVPEALQSALDVVVDLDGRVERDVQLLAQRVAALLPAVQELEPALDIGRRGRGERRELARI